MFRIGVFELIGQDPFSEFVMKFLALPDPDPLVRGANPGPNKDPSLYSEMCWAVLNNAFEIKFYHKILAKN